MPKLTLDDVAALALSLPAVTEGTWFRHRTWLVAKKAFAWERPFTKADLRRLGDEPVPPEPIIALATEDVLDKEALLEAHPEQLFTIAHFDGYPAVLLSLSTVGRRALRGYLTDAWLAVAPEDVARAYLAR